MHVRHYINILRNQYEERFHSETAKPRSLASCPAAVAISGSLRSASWIGCTHIQPRGPKCENTAFEPNISDSQYIISTHVTNPNDIVLTLYLNADHQETQ